MIRRSVLLALSTLLFAGCRVQTDLGIPCELVRAVPDGGKLPILEGEIKANKDFISFGAVECEDQVCVRDSAYQRDQTRPDSAPALGYCTRPCVPNSSVGCPASNAADDKDPLKRLTCRPLLLDETTLAAICSTSAETCTRYFGDTKSPFFCARGTPTDGGTN